VTRRWQILVEQKGADVCGFKWSSTARSHVADHFLEPKERWEQLTESPAPGEFRRRRAESSKKDVRERLVDEFKVLDDALAIYEGLVEKHTSGRAAVRTKWYLHEPDTGGKPYCALGVVSNAGIFAAFFNAELSDLRTAFRPDVGSRRGPIRIQDYVDAAHTYLDRKLARAALLGEASKHHG
jgi:hypothetical protein